MSARSLGTTAVLSLLLAAGAAAQEHPNVAKGMGGPATADVDTINPFNGNLTVRLPIGQSYPVNAGLSYQLVLTYNSQVWEHEIYDDETRAIPARGANAGLGWMLHLGRLNPPQLENNSSPSPDYSRNTYLAPDGSIHTFYPTLHEGESAVAGVEYTRDGTYMRLKTASRQIELPDGTVHTFSALTNGYLTRIEDRFANFVQVDYLDCPSACSAVAPSAAHTWQITDTQGRLHKVQLRDTGQPYQPLVVTQVDLQAFGGARAVYKLRYNDSTDDQSTTGSPVGLTGCGGLAGTSNHLVWFLTRLVLPDGSFYDLPTAGYFASNIPGDFSTPCKTGLLNRLRLPTQGMVGWDYRLYKFPSISTSRNIWQKATGVSERQLLDGASASLGLWTYGTVLSGGTTAHEKVLTNTVTDPLGNKVARTFSVCVDNCTSPDGPYEYGLPVGRDVGTDGAGRFLSTQVLDAASTPLRTNYSRYEHDTPSASSLIQERRRLNQRLASQRTAFNDDTAGSYADEDLSDFDGLGHYRSRQTNGNFPGSNLRSSYTAFNLSTGTYGQPGYVPWPAGSPWVIGTQLYAWDSEAGKTQYRISCFEAGTGFLQRYRVLKNSGAAESSADVLQVFQRNAAGNVATESFYGGDTQALPADACGMTLPASPVYQYTHSYAGGIRSQTSVTVGTALKTLDLTVDASTGLASASRNTAGKQTGFSYDPMGRLTTVDPADDLLTTYSYCTATSSPACPASVRAQVVTARKATVAGAETTASRLRFDDWGRLISEEERMPPSGTFAIRTTNYNALGWRTYASEQGLPGSGTTFLSFDAFGRPRTVRPPDGSSHDVNLAYQGVRQRTRTLKVATSTAAETNAVTTEIYDRYGRLYEVTEPNNVKTRYDYDVGNRLVKACQGATGAGTATCGQQRLFNYDLRGFLLSEQHPEKGLAGNGTVSYFNYDPLGHAGRRVDGPNDLTFTFDRAERLTQARETGGSQRVLKAFTYATANVTDMLGTDWRKGKVVSASRFNYVGAPFNATAEVRDTFVYRAAEGRVSETSRQLIFNGTDEEKFTTTYAYDGLGLVSTLGYPDCVFGDCTASDTPRTVAFSYSYGRLVSVPGVTGTAGGVSQISYYSNGLVNQVPHANGVLFTQQNDPNGIMRPGGMSAAKGAATLWTAGAYAYDGAGSVKATGAQTYVYDSLGRIVQGNLPGTVQGYAYDNYGNLQSITTDMSVQNTPTSSSTNRLTAGTYDAAGNLTAWSGNTYEYDGFNQLARYHSGAEDWIYVYGPDDERFWSYRAAGAGAGSTWTLRDLSGAVLRESNAHLGWGNYEDYVYREGLLLAGLLSSGQQRHFDVDHLGSVRLVTDAAGNQVSFHRYYPFGREQTALQEGDPMKFTGHERDFANVAGDGDDLDYMHARHYSMITGRFLSYDPIGGNPSAPQSWNRYAYVMNRPMTYTDPYGLIGFTHIFLPVGMTLDDFSFSETIYVVTTAWRGTTSNPFTGMWGLSSLLSGSSLFSSLTALGDLAYLRPSDFSFGRTADVSGMGLAAFTDGVIPFIDPFENAGVYNPDELGLEYSQKVGEYTRNAEILIASTGSNSLFGGGTWANKGQYLRVGHSFTKGQTWFAIRGQWVDKLTGAQAKHIYLWIVRAGR
ncbi:MAG TPA: RHS repeat-associated core domain-containing protein [Thermoanaerobaculia bacterium]|nr:RHS repeat-associated core domain-containing protein [Thermoanaerobaculia bacterium]